MANIRRIGELMRRHDARPYCDPRRWGPGWYYGPWLSFGNRWHGDAIPSWYDPAPYQALRTQFWHVINPWFFTFTAENPNNPRQSLHTATNTALQTRNLRVHLKRAAGWSTIMTIAAPESDLFFYDASTVASTNSEFVPPDGGGSAHPIQEFGRIAPHGYGLPTYVADPWNIEGVAVDIEVRQILQNPNGADDRTNAQILVQTGADLYPAIGAPIPANGTWLAVGGSGCALVTNSWQFVGYHSYFGEARPNIGSDTLIGLDTDTLMLATPAPGWSDSGGIVVPPPPPPPPSSPSRRVLFVGDSFVRGDEATTSGHRSFRGKVLADLTAAGITVDAVGREQLAPAIGGDPDHEGHASAYLTTTSNNLADRVDAMTAYIGTLAGGTSADAVVLCAGLEDYVNTPTGIGERWRSLVSTLRAQLPAAALIPVTLPPRQGLTQAQTAAAYPAYATLNTTIRNYASATYGTTLADGATAALVSGDYHGAALLLQAGADKLGAIVSAALRAEFGAPSSYVVPGMPRRGYVFPRIISSKGIVGPMGNNFQAPEIVLTAPGLTSPAEPTGAVNVRMSWRMAVTGSPTPTVSVSGTLPAGLSLSGLEVSGTPTTAGTSTVTFTASNGITPTATLTATFTITARAAVTTTTLPNGVVGIPYYQDLSGTGTGTLVWSITGTLPAGLSISQNAISGTPTATGSASLSAIVSDNNGPSVAQALSFTVAAAGTAPPPIFIDGQWQRLPRDVEVWVRIPRDT